MSFILVMSVLLVLSTVVVGVRGIHNKVNQSQARTFIGLNVFTFFTLIIGATVFIFSGSDVMASTTATDLAINTGNQEGMKYIAAALSTGLAAIGAGIAVAISGSAAIGAISEDAKLLGKTVIFVGLAEGIAIYGLIISIMILGS